VCPWTRSIASDATALGGWPVAAWVLRYENEAGKGDHCHGGVYETAYRFTTIEQWLEDFGSDTRDFLDEHPHHR